MAGMNLKLIAILSISHVFIDLTGGALPAVMPFLKNGLELNYAQVGAVIMISNLTSSIIQPLLGHFSDKRQIRWLLPASVALTYAGFSSIGLSPTYLLLLILIILNGIGIAFYRELTSLQGSSPRVVQPVAASAEDRRGTWTSMGFLVLVVTMRSWAHMGLLTFVPFYYMNVLKVIALVPVVGLIPILLMHNPERKTAWEATAE